MCNGMSSKECNFTGKKVLANSNVQWNVFKGVYFYWEKSTPQFKIELISGEYFLPCGSKFFPGKYYSGSTFFPGTYYSGSNFFRGVIIYGYTGIIREKCYSFDSGICFSYTVLFTFFFPFTLKLFLQVPHIRHNKLFAGLFVRIYIAIDSRVCILLNCIHVIHLKILVFKRCRMLLLFYQVKPV